MKEIHYFVAEDGTEFEYEDECILYENEQIFKKCKKIIKL